MQYKIEGSIADAIRVDMNALRNLSQALDRGMEEIEKRYSSSFSPITEADSSPAALPVRTDAPPSGFSPLVDVSLPCNVFSRRSPGVPISLLVYHYTTGGTPQGIVEWWEKSRSGSAHYIIDKDGKIYGCVPEIKKAWHAGNYNTMSIGIEFCAKIGEKLTDEQTEAGVKLSKDIAARHPINRISGHRFLGQATSCPGSLWDSADELDKWVVSHGILEANHAAS